MNGGYCGCLLALIRRCGLYLLVLGHSVTPVELGLGLLATLSRRGHHRLERVCGALEGVVMFLLGWADGRCRGAVWRRRRGLGRLSGLRALCGLRCLRVDSSLWLRGLALLLAAGAGKWCLREL